MTYGLIHLILDGSATLHINEWVDVLWETLDFELDEQLCDDDKDKSQVLESFAMSIST